MDLKWSISIKEEFMKLKKLMSIILAVSLAGGLAACGSGAKKEDSPGTQAGQTTQEAGQ